jgi:hypothetical protein
MASRGTTFAKQERDRAKKARAAEKRERRAQKGVEEENLEAPEIPAEGEEISPADLLRLVEELHQAFADERIDFDEFEERKAELMERISVE